MPVEGFLLVDKPGGWTSHDVVAKVRGLARTKKVGHAGTLDPMATGLLVLGLGRATRLLRYVQDRPKEYLARACFGVATDTLDADGVEVERRPMRVSASDVEGVLERFRGPIEQVPPMTSAIKIGGRKLYELARRGEEIERPARRITIHELELTGWEDGTFPQVELRVVASSGTYVRTLADDIAAALGGRAHLTALRRQRVGSLSLDDAVALDALADDPDRIAGSALSLVEGLADMAQLTVGDELGRRIAHGSLLSPRELPIAGPTAVVDGSGGLLAVYAPDGSRMKPEVVLQ